MGVPAPLARDCKHGKSSSCLHFEVQPEFRSFAERLIRFIRFQNVITRFHTCS
jgi:hypothetical protein